LVPAETSPQICQSQLVFDMYVYHHLGKPKLKECKKSLWGFGDLSLWGFGDLSCNELTVFMYQILKQLHST
jgi:hypothetical protein